MIERRVMYLLRCDGCKTSLVSAYNLEGYMEEEEMMKVAEAQDWGKLPTHQGEKDLCPKCVAVIANIYGEARAEDTVITTDEVPMTVLMPDVFVAETEIQNME